MKFCQGMVEMDPYYILKVENFDINKDEYRIKSQTTLDNVVDEEPSIHFSKSDPKKIGVFFKYDLHFESKKKIQGRAYGRKDPFNEFIFIDSKSIYYDKKNNLLILHTNNSIFDSFFKAFNSKDNLDLKKLDVDFDEILNNRESLGVTNLWLNGMKGDQHLSSAALNGSNVKDSQKYKDFRDEGAELTNVTILYNNLKKQNDKVMITKDGGIVFYNHHAESDALKFTVDCYKKFILGC